MRHRRPGLLAALASVVICACLRATAIPSAAEVPGVYVWRQSNSDDSSNQVSLYADGGYCHRYIVDGGAGSECGDWNFRLMGDVSVLELSGFRPGQYLDRPVGRGHAFVVERVGGRRRIVVDSDTGLYFVQVDGGGQ
jgi:hypothetical protein